MDPLNPNCKELASPGYFNFTLSILILFGILLSYIPQHARIISLKSSFGISPYFILLGTTSGTSSFANILTLPKSARDVSCCREISGVACFATMLGMLQVGAQWLGFFIILLLFVTYFPRATSPISPVTSESTTTTTTIENGSSDGKDNSKGPTYKTALTVTALSLFHGLVITIISITVALRNPTSLQYWANFLGIMAAVLASIQYLPQIYTTLRLRCVGSLSIPMMCFQTPGSLVWAASLAARVGREGWSTWGVYLLTACLQGTLLVMAVYFEYLGSRKKGHHHGEERGVKDGDDEDGHGERHQHGHEQDEHPSEETPLLQSQ